MRPSSCISQFLRGYSFSPPFFRAVNDIRLPRPKPDIGRKGVCGDAGRGCYWASNPTIKRVIAPKNIIPWIVLIIVFIVFPLRFKFAPPGPVETGGARDCRGPIQGKTWWSGPGPDPVIKHSPIHNLEAGAGVEPASFLVMSQACHLYTTLQ